MRSWLKPVLPAPRLLGFAILFYLAAWLTEVGLILWPAHEVALSHPSATSMRLLRYYWHVVWMPREAILRRLSLDLTMSLFGLFRALAFHPAGQRDYREWLTATPWRLGIPLPNGPVELVRQDWALALATAALLLMARDPRPLDPTLFFLASYATGSLLTLRFARSPFVPGVVAGLGFVVPAVPDAGLTFLVLAPVASACALAMRRSLAPLADFAAEPGPDPDPKLVTKVGLGLGAMSPGAATPRFADVATRLIWAAVVVWWCFVVVRVVAPADSERWEASRDAAVVVIGVAVVARLVRYTEAHGPPLGVLARLATRRFLIPSYDVVFVTPLVMLALGFGLPHLLRGVVSDGLAWSIAIFAALACGVLGGPDWQRWRLTAEHTIRVDGTTSGGLQIELTSPRAG